uniref:Putative secreted protein n=1 Tax=Ixodes scapularis TaxID=6945 RepID=A0A4D5RDV0_IXOSC
MFTIGPTMLSCVLGSIHVVGALNISPDHDGLENNGYDQQTVTYRRHVYHDLRCRKGLYFKISVSKQRRQ